MGARRRALAGAAALCVTVTVAACTSAVSGRGTVAPASSTSSRSSSPAADAAALERRAKQALLTATSFHLKGRGNDGSETIVIDMHYGADSSDGSLTFGGAPLRLRYAGGDVYLRADDAFWRYAARQAGGGSGELPDSVIATLRGRWVHVPDDVTGISDIAAIAIRQQYVQSVSGQSDSGPFRLGPRGVVRGIPVVSFIDTSDRTTVYVAAQGTPYPLRIVGPTHGAGGTFDIDSWNVPFSAPRPPASEIVELPR